jgi:AcrR family transcriptional regulator
MAVEPRQPSLKERQRNEREQLILQEANELLLECGYHDTSIDDIAARVGISKGTVYQHFGSKEEIVAALFQRGMLKVLETLEAIFSSQGTPREKLDAVIRALYSNMDHQHFRLMGTLLSSPEFHKHMEERRRIMGELWAEPRRRVTALLEEGKATGEFDRDIPTSVMVSLFWSMLSPFAYKQLIAEEQLPGNIVAEYISRIFFRGISPAGECSAKRLDPRQRME